MEAVDPRPPADLPGRKSSTWWGQQSDGGRDVYEAALARTRYAFEHFDHLYVSFSGGKDSTAVLNVALTVAAELDRLPLRVVFFDEECLSTETVEYVERVAELTEISFEWWCLPVRHRNACSSEQGFWWPWAPEDRDRWVRPLPHQALTVDDMPDFPVEPADARLSIPDTAVHLMSPFDRYGKTGMLMGIRAQESVMRRYAVSSPRPDNFIVPQTPGVSKVYPVYDWTTEDVWTAPARLGWDYNRTYDVMEMMGMSHGQQRVAPPFGEEPSQNLYMWAECFPDVWERMCARVPGAATAARYSRTELYSFREAVEKPDGISWRAFVEQLVAAHDDDARPKVAAKVRQMIGQHYRKTAEPLMPTARHPLTGLSWQRIAMFALRGDLKMRRSSMNLGGLSQIAKRRGPYDEERAAVARGEISL